MGDGEIEHEANCQWHGYDDNEKEIRHNDCLSVSVLNAADIINVQLAFSQDNKNMTLQDLVKLFLMISPAINAEMIFDECEDKWYILKQILSYNGSHYHTIINRREDGSFMWVKSDGQKLEEITNWTQTIKYFIWEGFNPVMLMYESVGAEPSNDNFEVTEEDYNSLMAGSQ